MAEKKSNLEFQGFSRPTTTPIPDELFDELLPDLTGAELKVLLYICRRTFGFKKDSDNISLNQMLKGITRRDGTQLDRGVGLSKPTLLRALKSLAKKKIINTEQRESAEKGFEATNYSLNFIDPLGKKMNQGEYQNFTKPLVKKSNPQQTVLQQTDVVVIDNLIKKKISKDKAQELISKFPPEYIQEKLDFLEWKLKLQAQGKARGRPISDPAAWLVKAIEKDYKPPDEFFEWRQNREEIERQEAAVEKERTATKQREQEIRQQLREQVGAPPNKELEETWKLTLVDLKQATTEAIYKTWLANSELLMLENGEAVIGFPNPFARDRVETQWSALIQNTLSKNLNGDQVTLRFIALEDVAGSSQ